MTFASTRRTSLSRSSSGIGSGSAVTPCLLVLTMTPARKDECFRCHRRGAACSIERAAEESRAHGRRGIFGKRCDLRFDCRILIGDVHAIECHHDARARGTMRVANAKRASVSGRGRQKVQHTSRQGQVRDRSTFPRGRQAAPVDTPMQGIAATPRLALRCAREIARPFGDRQSIRASDLLVAAHRFPKI